MSVYIYTYGLQVKHNYLKTVLTPKNVENTNIVYIILFLSSIQTILKGWKNG